MNSRFFVAAPIGAGAIKKTAGFPAVRSVIRKLIS